MECLDVTVEMDCLVSFVVNFKNIADNKLKFLGLKGASVKGEPGYAGRDGDKGDKGESGLQGIRGDTPNCPALILSAELRGDKGSRGEKGDTGQTKI